MGFRRAFRQMRPQRQLFLFFTAYCLLPSAYCFRQSPIDDQGFAVLAEHDVRRFDVAVQDAAAVGVSHRVADGDEAGQQGTQLEFRRSGIVDLSLRERRSLSRSERSTMVARLMIARN